MSTIAPAEGFAIAEDGTLIVETVAATRRAAVVNWLVVRRGEPVFAWDSDAIITKRFAAAGGGAEAKLVRVNVSPTRASAASEQQNGEPDPRDALLTDIKPVLEGIADTVDVPGEPPVIKPLLERIARELPGQVEG